MKRYIYITTQFEGIHRYKDAPSQVSYLREFHRHLFKIRIQVEVEHNERDIEFIMFKHQIDNFIEVHYLDKEVDLSCESIAEELIEYVILMLGDRKVICEVSEDGENGAILESEDYLC